MPEPSPTSVMSRACDPLTLHSSKQGYTIYARLRLAALVAEMNGFLVLRLNDWIRWTTLGSPPIPYNVLYKSGCFPRFQNWPDLGLGIMIVYP